MRAFGSATAASTIKGKRAGRARQPASTRSDLLAIPSGDGPFSCLSPETRARLVEACQVSRVHAGRVIFRKGDAPGVCYLILKGAVKVSLPSGNGQEVLLAVLGSGDVVGEMALLDQLPRSATVTALKSCELCHLTTATLEWLAKTDIAIYHQLLRVLSARLRAGNEAKLSLQMPMRARLARALLQLAEGFGERLPGGRILIRQKLSQIELGRMAGAARENVNRQLTNWRRTQLVTRISGYYCLERPQVLEHLARRHPER